MKCRVYLLNDQDLVIVIFKLYYCERKLWSRFQITRHDISIICNCEYNTALILLTWYFKKLYYRKNYLSFLNTQVWNFQKHFQKKRNDYSKIHVFKKHFCHFKEIVFKKKKKMFIARSCKCISAPIPFPEHVHHSSLEEST